MKKNIMTKEQLLELLNNSTEINWTQIYNYWNVEIRRDEWLARIAVTALKDCPYEEYDKVCNILWEDIIYRISWYLPNE